MKKIIFSLSILILMLVGCSNNDDMYAQFYVDSERIYEEADTITNHYVITWQDAIDDGEDFNVALMIAQLEKLGQVKRMNIRMEELSDSFAELSKGDTDTELYKEIRETYNHLSDLVRMADDPNGSLMSYRNDRTEVVNSFNRTHGMLGGLLTREIKDKANEYKELTEESFYELPVEDEEELDSEDGEQL